MPDFLLNEQVFLHQPKDAFRTGLDAVLLSALMPSFKTGRVLDMGSGVGAVSLCYATINKTDVRITGLELHPTFAEFAEKNIVENNLSDRVDIVNADAKDGIFGGDVFNGVMTNPPFEKADCADHSQYALKNIAKIEGTLDLENWIAHGLLALKCRGYYGIIHKMERLDTILTALHLKAGDIHILPIETKYNVAPKRVIVIARKGVKTGVTMLPVLRLQEVDGNDTPIAQTILSGSIPVDIFKLKEWNA